jgi:cbb3-type cytochrome oxidase cytochrome c subunit
MKSGLCVFLAVFAAFCASWFGLVYGPVHQLGGEKQDVVLQSSDNWPQQRTGEATLGLQVYRACGCAACHTEQVRQTGAADEIALTSLGSNKADDFKEFLKSLMVVPELYNYSNTIVGNLAHWNGQLPVTLYSGDDSTVVSTLAGKLKAAGVKTDARVVATGVDIQRGWGLRQSVAADYLYDVPVQLGSLRAGPDLTMVGVRMPDANLQWLHLYAPKGVTPTSTMPPFRFLFEVRKITDTSSPDALKFPDNFPHDLVPAAGYEVVPTAEARELVAYLLSLKANAPLYEAPFTPLTAVK